MPREATDMTVADLNARSEQQWIVWGPCSGGVRSVLFCDGRMYTFADGDARDAGSCGIVEETVEEYAAGAGAEASVVAWLGSAGSAGRLPLPT
jgi:hypothetical protein